MNESQRRLADAYAIKDERQLVEQYDSWATDYDADLAACGYRMPPVISGLVVRHFPDTDAPILDAGSGTGILGEALHVLGYSDITAIDLSAGMLRVAAGKGIYRVHPTDDPRRTPGLPQRLLCRCRGDGSPYRRSRSAIVFG